MMVVFNEKGKINSVTGKIFFSSQHCILYTGVMPIFLPFHYCLYKEKIFFGFNSFFSLLQDLCVIQKFHIQELPSVWSYMLYYPVLFAIHVLSN